MARSATAVADGLSSDEQAQMDAMRAADSEPEAQAQETPEPTRSSPEETAGAPAEAPEGQPEAQQRRQQNVPLAALHEERDRHKETRSELQQVRHEMATLQERTNLILQRLAPQQEKPADAAIPSLDQDPLGHLLATQRRTEERLAEFQRAGQISQQQAQQLQAISGLQQRATAYEQAFRQQNPDYDKAVDYLSAQRDRELAVMIPDPLQRRQAIFQEALGTAAMAIQNNLDPASVLYEIAKGRGYKIPEPAKSEQQQPAAADRLSQVAAGQQQARGLGAVRGAGAAPVSADTILKMSDDEFYKNLGNPEFMAIFGA